LYYVPVMYRPTSLTFYFHFSSLYGSECQVRVCNFRNIVNRVDRFYGYIVKKWCVVCCPLKAQFKSHKTSVGRYTHCSALRSVARECLYNVLTLLVSIFVLKVGVVQHTEKAQISWMHKSASPKPRVCLEHHEILSIVRGSVSITLVPNSNRVVLLGAISYLALDLWRNR
jgi:hypothetical protein